MIPFRFGTAQRQMYGVYHPSDDRASTTSVLLCNPFGQEAIRTHRIYRVLAERLAASGKHVLRFDYYATGDSSGHDEEGELEGWREDVAVAHAELLRRSRCKRMAWFGARLGGSLAMLGADAVSSPPARLVLWEPVVVGAQYLNEIGGSSAEAMGFSLGEPLVRQLRLLSATSFPGGQPRTGVVISRPGIPGMKELTDALRASGGEVANFSFEHSFDWVSDEALNTAIVPMEAIQILTSHLDGLDS